MDYGLLVIFLLSGSWFYGAALLGMRDWRWHLGRIVLFLLCFALTGWFLLSKRTGGDYIRVTAVLFAATVFLPSLLTRCVFRLLTLGRIRAALRWQRLHDLLAFRRSLDLAKAVPGIDAPDAPHVSDEFLGRMAAPLLMAMTRRQFHAARMEACLAIDRPREALVLFEAEFSGRASEASPAALCLASLAEGEMGNLRKSAALLRNAEEQRRSADRLDVRSFTAYVRLYSASGRPEELDDFVRRHQSVASYVSQAGLAFRAGMARINAGDRETGERKLLEAMSLLEPYEDRLRDKVQRALWEAERAPAAAAPDEEVAAELDALRRIEARPVAPARFEGMSSRPIPVTGAIVVALAAVWILTEISGSSEDTRTLLRFGANASALVRNGEWWRLIASVFLHVGLLHLLFNAYACHLFGGFVERTSGRWETWAIFLLSGIAGSAASALLGGYGLSAGASGAVFGLLGAATVISLRFRHSFPQRMRRVLLLNFIFIAAANMVYGMFEPHIDNLAHGGGMAAGVVLGIFAPPYGRKGIRHRAFVLAGCIALGLTVAAGVQAAVNVAAGYPHRLPPMKARVAPAAHWKIDVPAFWEPETAGPDRMEFEDLFGAFLMVGRDERRPVTAEEAAGESERVVSEGLRQAGHTLFHEIVLEGGKPRERTLRRLCQIRANRFTYVIVFECLAEDDAAYRGLLTRILGSLEVGPNDK